jgi:predicted HTH transcriptional regulator
LRGLTPRHPSTSFAITEFGMLLFATEPSSKPLSNHHINIDASFNEVRWNGQYSD